MPMTTSGLNEAPLLFRRIGEDSGLLLVARGSVSPSSESARLWSLRRDCFFAAQDAAVQCVGAASIPPCVELVLCAGLASNVDWAALSGVVLAIRAAQPDALLRLELWIDEHAPAIPTGAMLQVLRSVRPLFVHLWIRDRSQLTEPVRGLAALLIDGGLPVVAEVLLLRGPASTVEAMRGLCLELLELRMRPYTLVDAAWVPAEERAGAADSEAVVRGLRGWISGLAVPQLVEESRTGERSLRIPAYVVSMDEAGTELVSYAGARHRYPNPPE